MSKSTRLHWRIAFCLWLVVVTVATHRRVTQGTETPIFITPDKMFHFVSFGVLAMTFWCSGWIKQKLTVVLLLLLWTLVDEFTQALLPIDRPFSIADITASMLGVLVAAGWMGGLSHLQFCEVNEKIDSLLSRTRAWLVLCPVAMIGTIGIGAFVWLILWKTLYLSLAPLSLCISLLMTTVVLLAIISAWADCFEKKLAQKLLPQLIILGVVSVIIGYAMRSIEVGPSVVGIAFFGMGSSRIWQATITDKFIWGTI